MSYEWHYAHIHLCNSINSALIERLCVTTTPIQFIKNIPPRSQQCKLFILLFWVISKVNDVITVNHLTSCCSFSNDSYFDQQNYTLNWVFPFWSELNNVKLVKGKLPVWLYITYQLGLATGSHGRRLQVASYGTIVIINTWQILLKL